MSITTFVADETESIIDEFTQKRSAKYIRNIGLSWNLYEEELFNSEYMNSYIPEDWTGFAREY